MTASPLDHDLGHPHPGAGDGGTQLGDLDEHRLVILGELRRDRCRVVGHDQPAGRTGPHPLDEVPVALAGHRTVGLVGQAMSSCRAWRISVSPKM